MFTGNVIGAEKELDVIIHGFRIELRGAPWSVNAHSLLHMGRIKIQRVVLHNVKHYVNGFKSSEYTENSIRLWGYWTP